MPTPTQFDSPNCYPACSNTKITENMLKLNPCIDISILDIQLTGPAVIDAFKSFGKWIWKKGSSIFTSDIKQAEKKLWTIEETVLSSNRSLFSPLYGFLSLISHNSIGSINNIPIFSSPQIQIKASPGFEGNQSLFNFLRKAMTGGLASFLGGQQGLKIGSSLAALSNDIETLGEWAGWSPQLSPYFSFKKDPFGNKPTLSVTLHLINDTEEAAAKNSTFLTVMFKNSLVGSIDAKRAKAPVNSTKIFNKQNSLFHRWSPPNLFEVGLKFGADAGTNYVKKYHLCKLEATVVAEGMMRNGIIPDAYTVNMTFESIMPETVDAWLGADYPGINQTTLNSIISNLAKNADPNPIAVYVDTKTNKKTPLYDLVAASSLYYQQYEREPDDYAPRRGETAAGSFYVTFLGDNKPIPRKNL